MAVLSCILQDPPVSITECVRRLRDGSIAFYDLRNQTLYDVLVDLFDKGTTIDVITVQQRLKDDDLLEMCGGPAWLSELTTVAPSAANLGYYLNIVEEKFLLRKMIRTCTEIVARVYDYQGEVSELIDDFERTALSLRPQQIKDESAKVLVKEAVREIESLWERKGSIGGISTGLGDLDRITDGLHPGEMIVLAAYPSTGKSALAVNIAVTNALAGISAAIFSLEMKPVQLMVRSICSESRVNLYNIRDNTIVQSDFNRLITKASALSAAPIHLHDSNGFTIAQLKAAMRQSFARNNIKFAVIDYLQLVSHPNCDSREQEVSAISKGVKSIAMELNIPVMVLSQLNDDGKLRESRAIGQDADSVWKLDIEGEKQPQDQPVTLRIEKNRNGPIGKVNVLFRKQFTRFEGVSRVTDADAEEARQERFKD